MKKKFVLLFIILSLSLFYGCAGNEVKVEEKQTVTEAKTEVTTLPEATTNPESTNNSSTTQKAESTETTKRSSTEQTTTKPRNSNSNSADNREHSTEHSSSSSGSSSSGTHKHSISTGDIGKWFDSRSQLQAYVSSIMESWNTKYENGTITWEEYIANCPQGYECWSCSGCGKWTGNFKSQTVY